MSIRTAISGLLIALFFSIYSGQITKSREDSILEAINRLAVSEGDDLEDIQQWLLNIGPDVVPYLVRALEFNPDIRVRYQAALLLGNTRSGDAVRPLFISSQLDTSREVREASSLALENLLFDLERRRISDTTYRRYDRIPRSTVVAIKRTLKSDPDPAKRDNAAESLGSIGKKSDIMDILDMLSGEKVEKIRIAMLQAAEKLARPEMLEVNYKAVNYTLIPYRYKKFRMQLTDRFLYVIRNDNGDNVRCEAVKSLTRLVYPIFVLGEERLARIKGFENEHRYIINEVTIGFLNMISHRDYEEIRGDMLESVILLLNAYFRRSDSVVDDELRRRLTIEVFDVGSDYRVPLLPYTVRVKYERNYTYVPLKMSALAERARKVFNDVLNRDSEPENRRLAIKGLSTLGRRSDSRYIMNALQRERDADVWLTGVEALGMLGSTGSGGWLYSVLENRNVPLPVRMNAAVSIGLINEERSRSAMLDFFYKAEEPALQKAIIEATGLMKDNRSGDFLVNLLKSNDPSIRRAAVNALTSNTWRPSVSSLADILQNDKDPDVRASAVAALNKNDPAGAFSRILTALDDEHPRVRRAAAIEIGIMKEKRGAAKLADVMLNDKDATVRLEATRSLGIIGDRQSVQLLVEAIINDDDFAVRDEAIRSLLLIRQPQMGIVAILSAIPQIQKENPEAVKRLDEAHYYLRLQWEGYLQVN